VNENLKKRFLSAGEGQSGLDVVERFITQQSNQFKYYEIARNFSQNDLSGIDYFNKKKMLSSCMFDESEQKFIYEIMRNLDPDFVLVMKNTNFKSLDNLREEIEIIDEKLMRKNEKEVSLNNVKFRKLESEIEMLKVENEKVIKQMNAMKLSNRKEGNAEQKREKKDLSKIRCFGCSQFGHIKSNCPMKVNSNSVDAKPEVWNKQGMVKLDLVEDEISTYKGNSEWGGYKYNGRFRCFCLYG
jgi:hypothetical protein